jgi:hypothetical protein
MDVKNRFETPTTAVLARLEAGSLLMLSAALALNHLGQINWPAFVALFVVIDAVGYIPGAIAYHRSRDGAISRTYYVLYNSMHSLTGWVVVGSAWTYVNGWSWALLAVPIHLLGDRAVFGNTLKPFRVSFEPVTHPAFAEFEGSFAATPPSWPASALGEPAGTPEVHSAPPALSSEVERVHG